MQERINSFLLYLYHIGSIRKDMCGPELEFTLKRVIKSELVTVSNNKIHFNMNTKKHILNL